MFAKQYAVIYDILNQEKPYKKEIEFVYDWAGRPKSIFDIGCGTASYWQHFPKETILRGIDKSRSMALVGSGKDIVCGDITEYRQKGSFDCAVALFDVLNYIPFLGWWRNIPVRSGGHFIFDVWDKRKVDQEGFEETFLNAKGIHRHIIPKGYNGRSVDLEIQVTERGKFFKERHEMFVHDIEDIERACGHHWVISGIKETEGWQTWYRLRKR